MIDFLIENTALELVLFFLIVTFLQSGFDKISDWKGNVGFINDHFKNSPLKNQVPLLLGIITLMEVIGGVLMLFGALQIAYNGEKTIAYYGLVIAAKTLIFLLIGQRLAKDYAGAMTLAVYFIVTILGLFLLGA